MPLARLAVGDVERWHTRLRQAGMGNAGVKNQHGVLRTALAQAVRWGSINRNVAGMARLRSTKQKRRTVMTLDEVRAVMAGAESIDPAAALMLRVAAVSGARRAELTALRWDDLHASCSRSTRPSRSSRAATASASPRRIDEDGQHTSRHARPRHHRGDRGAQERAAVKPVDVRPRPRPREPTTRCCSTLRCVFGGRRAVRMGRRP